MSKGKELVKIPEHVQAKAFGCDYDHHEEYLRFEVLGAGACFFHSVCAALVVGNLVENNKVVFLLETSNLVYQLFEVDLKSSLEESFDQVGIMLRKRLAQELKAAPKLFDDFLASTRIFEGTASSTKRDVSRQITDLLEAATWADTWTIKYTAWRLKVNFLFVNPTDVDYHPFYCGVEGFRAADLNVFIYWSGHMHFEPVFRVDQSKNNTALKVTRAFAATDPLVACFMAQYKETCPATPIQGKPTLLVSKHLILDL